MWTDNEAEHDFLNFGSVAKTVSQVIEDANEKPVSIGVSGAWGIGKSSMIKLIRNELKKSDDSQSTEENKYVFVEFNAWLYQGRPLHDQPIEAYRSTTIILKIYADSFLTRQAKISGACPRAG